MRRISALSILVLRRLRELISQFQLDQGSVSNATTQAFALRNTASVTVASHRSTPAASPVRGMVGKIAQAFTGRSNAAVATDSWEEF